MKINLKIKLLPLLFLPLFILSCEKDEFNQPIAYGDAIVRSFNQGDSIVYGIGFYAYSYDKMKEVSVSKIGESSKIMLDSTNYRYTYFHLPDSSGYLSTKPPITRFQFNITFDDGATFLAYDIVDSSAVKPAIISQYEYDQEDEIMYLDWNPVTHADLYRVILENDKKEVVFQSDFFASTQTYLWLSVSTYGWLTDKQPHGGEKFKVILLSYQYESSPSSFDLQSISFTEGDFFEWR